MEESKLDVEAIITAYRKAEPENSFSGLATSILKDYPTIGISHRTLRKKISESTDVKDILVQEDVQKFFVKDNVYHISKKGGYIQIPLNLIDDVFLHYSKFGHNLTGDEIQAKYDLKPDEWIAIKNNLNLFKTSDIFSPYTRENTPVSELENLMDVEMRKLFSSKGIIVKKYRQALERAYKSTIQKQNLRDAELGHLVSEIYDNLSIIKGEKYILPITTEPLEKSGVVALADIHFGSVSKNNKLISEYTMYDVENALMEIADRVNTYNFREVTVVILGDLIHSFNGNMHPEMWREMDTHEGIGGKLVVNTANLLAKFATRVNNFKSFEVVEGNHDRPTKDKSRITNELTYIICDLVSHMITAEVNFHGKRGSFVVDGINYVISHGDEPLDDKDVYRLLNRMGIVTKSFTVVLKAHRHSRMIASGDDNWDVIRQHCPSLFTQDSYTFGLGFRSRAGFQVIERDIEAPGIGWLPKINDHSVII